MDDKTYPDVKSMIRDLTDDTELIDAVNDAMDRQAIVRQLLAMRAARGLSQSDIAETMDCSQSRVSKMESSADDDLRYGDMREYARAVGCELKSGVRPKQLTPADEVKALAFAVNDRLSRMADLSQCDEKIAEGVTQFFIEAFLNFSIIIGRAASTLPQKPDGSPRIEVSIRRNRARDCPEDSPSNEQSQHDVAAHTHG